jgi:dipeptidyl aminopeptidase/acylaminoacyl peptidase
MEGLAERTNSLVAFLDLDQDRHRAFTFDPSGADGFPEGSVLSERGALSWRDDPSMILVGVKAQSPVVESDPESEATSVVVFHWKDDYLQTVQERRARFQESFTYRGGVHVPSGRYVQLADSSLRAVDVPERGPWAVGSDERAYISDWEEDRADYYRVDLASGERTPMLTAQKSTLGTSPDGRYFAYWKDGHVWVYDLEDRESLNLTASAPVSFVNEQYDHPGTKPPYGMAGWTSGGNGMVLNHRYDLWLQPLDGSPATSLTGGAGTREEIRFRHVRLDDDAETIDLDVPILLSAYGEWTKKSGFYELDGGRLTELVFQDRQYGTPTKAARRDRVIFTSQTFADYPDYYVSDLAFRDPERITDANPQQAEYTWGRSMLFDFANEDGVRLQGTLAIPDGYQPGQRLPMIVNFYDKKSQNLHAYWVPTFGGSYPSGNAGPVAEFGALHFNTRTTHSDMLDCVEAATRRVIEMGYADPERIALTGGSFSGGGSAFIATRSDMFAAIVSRAAPINLAGEFNILFSGSGQNNHAYDIYGQGRYGTNPFDDFELYREQSPITHVRTMDTPLLYMHGREDGSVEYLQGMEFYNALRFLGKPVIFLTYLEEGHNLRRYENQLDFTVRMRQFLDHYLKDAPAPDWMVNGLPFLERGR